MTLASKVAGAVASVCSVDPPASADNLNVARDIANTHNKQLLGNDDAEKSQVDEWVKWAQGFESATPEEQGARLTELHNTLADRVFLVSNYLTLADIAVFAAVASKWSTQPVDERTQYEHFALVRWFDLLQHNPRLGAVITPQQLEFNLNLPFKPPVKGAGEKSAGASAAPRRGKAERKPKQAASPKKGAEKGKEKETKEAGAPQQKQQEKPAKQPKQPKGKGRGEPKASQKKVEKEDIVRLDIRVGVIRKVSNHPGADTLYVEEIDLGEPEPRVVVSGLRNFIPESEMLGARVICLCNQKPAKLRNVMSYAIVLCGSNADHTAVELVNPPEGAAIGERVTFQGYEGEPDERLPPKRDIFSLLKPHLFVNDDLVACYRDQKTGKAIPFMTSAGPCTVKSLVGSSIA